MYLMRYHLKQKGQALRLCSGQALTELALFGSVMLLVVGFLVKYGMSMNYKQGLSMQAYRAAYKKAKEENDTLIRSRTGARSVTYMKIVEKVTPEPSNPFGLLGFSESTPYMQDSSASWTQRLFYDIKKPYKRTDMPRAVYDFGQKKYEFTTLGFKKINKKDINKELLRKKVSDLPDDIKFVPDPYFANNPKNRVPVTTINLSNDNDTEENKSWHWERVSLSEVGLGKNKITVVDLDGDEKEERLLKMDKGAIWVLDNDEAEIEKGIYISYLKDMDKRGSLIKKEYPGFITNLAELNVTEYFFYRIDLNKVSQKIIDQVRDNGNEDLLISKDDWESYAGEVATRTYIWESILRHLHGNKGILFDIDELARNIKDDINKGEINGGLSSGQAELLRNFLEERQGDLQQLISDIAQPNLRVTFKKFEDYFKVPKIWNFFRGKKISSSTGEPAVLLIRKQKKFNNEDRPRGWTTPHNRITHDELENL